MELYYLDRGCSCAGIQKFVFYVGKILDIEASEESVELLVPRSVNYGQLINGS
jgi:hypothetical protein